MERIQRGAGAWAVLVGTPLVLAAAAPLPAQALELLRTTSAGADPYAPVVAAVALLGWALVLWVWLVVLVLTAGRLPGLVGRAAKRLSRVVAPRAVRRALGLSLGLTLALGAATGPAMATAPLPGVTAGSDLPDLDWGSAPSPSPAPLVEPTPARQSAGSGTSGLAPLGTMPGGVGSGGVGSGGVGSGGLGSGGLVPVPAPVLASATGLPAAPGPTDNAAVSATSAGSVVVQRGDTLWGLATSSLTGPGTTPTAGQVAQTWPSWWAANRDAIGTDPDLLVPGTVLSPPPQP